MSAWKEPKTVEVHLELALRMHVSQFFDDLKQSLIRNDCLSEVTPMLMPGIGKLAFERLSGKSCTHTLGSLW